MKIDKNKHIVIYIYLIAVVQFLFLSCKEDVIVTPPTDKGSMTVVNSNKAILAYFPLNIGDIKYYNRIENKGWIEISYSQFVNICISDTTLENGLTYYKNEIQFFYSDSTQNMVGISYYKIDTSTQIIYEYIRHKNKEEVFLPLNLKVGESFSLSDEENIILSNFDTISVFNKQMGRKVFERRDIYGYTYHRYELLENIGLYNHLYRGDIIGSMEDSLRGATIFGTVIGDTTFIIQ